MTIGMPHTAAELTRCFEEARRRTLGLVDDLDDAQMIGPRLENVNPPLWEIGHVAWFQQFWTLRHLAARPPRIANEDALYNSAVIEHGSRWETRLPTREATLRYMRDGLEAVLDRLQSVELDQEELYFHRLVLFHEDMHVEALTYTRQTLGYREPTAVCAGGSEAGGVPPSGDVEIPGGGYEIGAECTAEFVFDNEQWVHEVELQAFRIARSAVTQAEFAAFVEDRGYARRELWTTEGWTWRQDAQTELPAYWRRQPGGEFLRRHYQRWCALEPDLPVCGVNAYEAEAFCRWAGRRLPTEAEWEVAARAAGGPYPWGPAQPSAAHAHLDLRSAGCVSAGAHGAGDSADGCRQMLGNTWEWTSTRFEPYEGFVPGPYAEYSAPWFGSRRVLRGGSFATPSRLLCNTHRNFHTPERRDVLGGFRVVGDS